MKKLLEAIASPEGITLALFVAVGSFALLTIVYQEEYMVAGLWAGVLVLGVLIGGGLAGWEAKDLQEEQHQELIEAIDRLTRATRKSGRRATR